MATVVAAHRMTPTGVHHWPAFSYAYQPLVDTSDQTVIGYEALIRGPRGEPALSVLNAVQRQDIYRFDELSRIRAIEIATRLGVRTQLNLNFLPRGLEESSTAISSVLETAARCGIEASRIVMEVTESEAIDDLVNFARAINAYRSSGIRMAIDDFGSGYSGLNLLANFQPDSVKLDMHLVRGIASHGPRQAIVRAIVQVCNDLGIDLVAEGLETLDELRWFEDEGVTQFQGYLFCKPQFETLALPNFPPRS